MRLTAHDGELTDADLASLYSNGIQYVLFLPDVNGKVMWRVRDALGERLVEPEKIAALLAN